MNKLKILLNKGIISSIKIVIKFLIAKTFKLPYAIMIEPTDLCNLKCTICYLQNTKLKREKHRMSFGEFKKLIDQVDHHIIYASLFFAGEPLINRDIYDMIAYCDEKDIITSISTNAMLMDEKASKNLINDGLDRLIISFDGATKKSYEKIRVGAKWETVIKNIKKMMKLKKEFNSNRPFVSLQMVVTKDNENEIDKFMKLANKLKVDEAYVKSLYTYTTGSKEFSDKLEKLVPTKESLKRCSTDKEKACQAYTRSVVLSDCTVVPCCFDEDTKYPMGNIKKEMFSVIWRSKKYRAFRNSKEKFTKSPICSKCGCTGEKDYRVR